MRSILLNHHFSGLDDSADRIAFLELEFVSTATSDGALDEIVTNPDNHMRHDVAKLNVFDRSTQFIPR